MLPTEFQDLGSLTSRALPFARGFREALTALPIPVAHAPRITFATLDTLKENPENFPIVVPGMGEILLGDLPLVIHPNTVQGLSVALYAMPLASERSQLPQGPIGDGMWPLHEGMRAISKELEGQRPAVLVALWAQSPAAPIYEGPYVIFVAPLKAEGYTLEHTKSKLDGESQLIFHTARYQTSFDPAEMEFGNWLYRSGIVGALAMLMATRRFKVVK